MADSQQQPAPSLGDLFTTLSEDEARVADEKIDRYLALALEAYERIRKDPARYAELQRRLTAERKASDHDEKTGLTPTSQ